MSWRNPLASRAGSRTSCRVPHWLPDLHRPATSCGRESRSATTIPIVSCRRSTRQTENCASHIASSMRAASGSDEGMRWPPLWYSDRSPGSRERHKLLRQSGNSGRLPNDREPRSVVSVSCTVDLETAAARPAPAPAPRGAPASARSAIGSPPACPSAPRYCAAL